MRLGTTGPFCFVMPHYWTSLRCFSEPFDVLRIIGSWLLLHLVTGSYLESWFVTGIFSVKNILLLINLYNFLPMLLTTFSPLNLFFEIRFSFRAKGFSVRPRVSVTLLLSCLVTYQHTVLNVVVGYVYKVPLRFQAYIITQGFIWRSQQLFLTQYFKQYYNKCRLICFQKKQKKYQLFYKGVGNTYIMLILVFFYLSITSKSWEVKELVHLTNHSSF